MLHRKLKFLNKQEERRLLSVWQGRKWDSPRALDARNQLVESQLAWCARITQQFCMNYKCNNEFEEYYSESCVKLLDCLDKVDPERGRLSTMLKTVIYRHLKRHYNQNRVIPLPQAFDLKGAGTDVDPSSNLGKGIRALNIMSSQYDVGWLEHQAPESYDDTKSREEVCKKVQKVLQHINPVRDRAVLQQRMNGHSLQEVGDNFNLSRERVRQIEMRVREEFMREWLKATRPEERT